MASPEVPLLADPDMELDQSLTTLEKFLGLLGFCQHTVLRAALSWFAFFLLAVALPLAEIELSRCSGCEKLEIETFELEILVSRAVVAAVSLLCISRNLRKYGIRKALFVDRCHGHMTQFRNQYIKKIRVFYWLLASWFGVCFILKAGREVARLMYLHNGSWWLSIILFSASLLSWSYLTLLFLSGCALFKLVGNLQIIHFENYGKVLEKDLDVSIYIEEHMNLTFDLSKISHRFRIFLLLEFFIVTASQFVALLQTTENQGIINFINGGDFGVLSIVQLVGIVLCLTAAAKISHRAQSLGSIASRWHALVTCNSNDGSGSGIVDNGGNAEVHPSGSLSVNYSGSDLESADYMSLPTNIHPAPSKSSYQMRQAFVTYVQSNTGGFTIFGWIVDRMLINTIFFIELSLVFFVLGKTITVTVR
ncbi:zinc finger CONSTANS-like protein [Perilla frutescens var. hirtella]|uniref:Zinc finger CONSTANS-like protein n=1 Tax=Perilla frutescens var. hirtella TaxID=608512 RepID=A0AAD4JE75_PERFH|nr:zinc finger CONSTANS-like protein [Perilla frutescens var. hirtella]KAH6807877.1 zinc finger CONSTANS-like protein [Perilla frutescens var. frutescens]KAH6831528.1 zinc finger CONSTANS-like protein [Perilla frutescens var. hirtella]